MKERRLRKISAFLPIFILLALLVLFWQQLFYHKPNEIPSPLIGKKVPNFHLPNLLSAQVPFSQADLKGKVSLLNIWASWCHACLIEHPMLMKIKNEYHIPIYGIAYKDKRAAIDEWLEKQGNPYLMIGDDNRGNVAIDFGVYGTPETFVISQGKMIYRHIGVLDQNTWDKVIYPLVKKHAS